MSEEKQVATIKEKQLPIKLGLTNAALTKLEKEYKEVPDASTPEGYEFIKKAKKRLTGYRTGVEAERKIQVEEAVKHQRRVNKVANEIKTRLVAIETPLYAAKQKVDDAAAEKKRQDILKEQNRVADIEDMISDIRDLTGGLLGADLATIEHRLIAANKIIITDAEYMEFVESASTALGQVKEQLAAAVESAKALATQQKEIDDRKKEQDDRDKQAGIKAKIAEIKMIPVEMMGATVAEMEDRLSGLGLDDDFGDQADDALEAVGNTRAKLESMINHQKSLDAQQMEIDDREAEATRKEEVAAEAERIQMEQEEVDKQKAKTKKMLADRMPEDMKLRAYGLALISVDIPDLTDPQLCAMAREVAIALSDINKIIYDGTQSPVDEEDEVAA